MRTVDINIDKRYEIFNFEGLSHVVIIAVLLLMSTIYGTKDMSESAVPMERKEMVHKANGIVLHNNKELLTSVEFSLEPIEKELKPEALVADCEVIESFDMMKSEGKIESVEMEKPEEIVVPIEPVRPEEIPVPIVSVLTYEGELREDYCVGSIIDLSELKLLLDENVVPMEECTIEGLDTSVPGDYFVNVTYDEYSVEIPYTVIDYKVILHGIEEEQSHSLLNYEMDANVIGTPVKLGKEFTGWYRDEACTIPFVTALPGEVSLDLYAGWKDFDKFVCDEAGYITGYTGGYGSITDGLLNLTEHPSCIGVKASAFVNLEEFVTDIYIPANITHIESGAFDCLPNVFYIYVHPDNPAYSSEAGILYTKDMSTVVAYPSCR